MTPVGVSFGVTNPYWGDHTVRPHWDLACIPVTTARRQPLGRSLSSSPTRLVEAARQDFPAAVASLGTAMAMSDLAAEDARFWRDLGEYVLRVPNPTWLTEVTDDASFVARLESEVDSLAGQARLGFGARLAQASAALAQGSSDLLNGVAADVVRRATPMASAFIGDTVSYLKGPSNSSTIAPHDAIRREIVSAIVSAATAAQRASESLILMGHSFGGVLLFDILSSPAAIADIEAQLGAPLAVDMLVSVGSQVALFEEFKLFEASDVAFGRGGRAPTPHCVRRWLNIFDRMDVLAFVAEPVFDRVTDLEMSTIAGVKDAHTAYFDNPVFYARLGQRLAQDGAFA